MNSWLLLDVELHFENAIKTKVSSLYRPDMTSEDSNLYYGIHFVLAPQQIHSGDQIVARILMRVPGRSLFIISTREENLR